ncbi:acyl-CoA dehydrogenase family protein [Catenuloplanes japonicus]|uniref:acyl-CoA dehydrogenase family protein n=1 Tax=Catenuloplanes japonicus TaxID=33876 RepID=UPI00068C7A8A|nr:acyl-CoA dehydrogenase family protein [Catenuloplanes japonicus]
MSLISTELIKEAENVAPVLAAHAARTEKELKPTPESIAAVRDAGLLRLTVPTAFGGHDASQHTLVRVGVALGRACPSTAWVTCLSASAKQMMDAMLPGQARAEIFADPDAVASASAVVTGAATETDHGGLRLDGRWRMASGSELATWAMLVAPVLVDGVPAKGAVALVPLSDLTIERTWRALGMAGTSSHTLVADGVEVPAHRTLLPPPPVPARFSVAAVLAHLAPVLGAAHGARDVVEAALRGDRAPAGTTYRRTAESPLARHWFAEASRLIDGALIRTLAVADALDETDTDLPIADRSRMRMDLVQAAQDSRAALARLLDLHGASGFTDDNPLQRFWRDAEVGSRYAGLNPFITAEDHGRLLLDEGAPVSMML